MRQKPSIPQTTAGGLLADVDPQGWIFTFGSGQQFDGTFVVMPGPYEDARAEMLRVFGNRWCAQYPFEDRAELERHGMVELRRELWPTPDPQVDTVRPIVRAAIGALDAFGAVSAREATILLGYWARRDQLSDADVEQVIGHYSTGAAPADDDDTADVDATGSGLDYDRADTATGPQPIPAHVDGWPINSRGGAQ